MFPVLLLAYLAMPTLISAGTEEPSSQVWIATDANARPQDSLWTWAQNLWRTVVKRADGSSKNEEMQAPLAFADVARQLTALQAAATDPLVKAHLYSVLAMLKQAWQSVLTLQTDNAEAAMDVLQIARQMLPALKEDSEHADAFHDGKLHLIETFVSPDDGKLQPYTVLLPRYGDPNAAHPLIVFLHGRGDPQEIHFVRDAEMHLGKPQDDAIVLEPWAHGNAGYRGFAERDVLMAIEQVRSQFNIDANRIYLSGFSMGGSGAWGLALHESALWAAVVVATGRTSLTTLGVGLCSNVENLPLLIWIGDADTKVSVDESTRMREELERCGIAPNVRIAHGVAHTFDDASWGSAVAWLLSHKRAALKEFTYVSDDLSHRGRNGVNMYRDATTVGFPKVHVRIDSAQVFVDSMGTPGLDVDLGPQGLDLHGTVTVFWNGNRVFSGDPRVVTLGVGGGKR